MLKAELETLRLKKRQEYLKLLEVARLTEDLAEATDRRDEVSVRMLLSMRQELLLELQEMDSAVREGLLKRQKKRFAWARCLMAVTRPTPMKKCFVSSWRKTDSY